MPEPMLSAAAMSSAAAMQQNQGEGIPSNRRRRHLVSTFTLKLDTQTGMRGGVTLCSRAAPAPDSQQAWQEAFHHRHAPSRSPKTLTTGSQDQNAQAEHWLRHAQAQLVHAQHSPRSQSRSKRGGSIKPATLLNIRTGSTNMLKHGTYRRQVASNKQNYRVHTKSAMANGQRHARHQWFLEGFQRSRLEQHQS